ncbi:alternative ribosome rescue aminoacyl-tRNA hydrolase ArfB [Puniceicoccus vermicola]|uniref:Aminoacyl-tRNA hydrolase n=1 Tax=Puniceicoccus vermicola TaxID=388746 RepID=A0A7X1B130_9BACT|nr:alternative ribosome rescue aminoacyl-tRNA hydrolase ArfB [Puniceicoccus vermicola]MBC2603676.1 aminoacyl-tRNA hydrolase [Puniceicoccus vermicola]
MLRLSNNVSIPAAELSFQAIRASGPGGQNVNKVSSAVQLFFNVRESSLPEFYKSRIFRLRDSRLTAEGIIVIRAEEHRSLEKNKTAAMERLRQMILKATETQKKRRPTRPTLGSKNRRIDSKKKRGKTKALRKRPDF